MTSEIACPLSEAAQVDQILKWMLAGESEFMIQETIQREWPESDLQSLITAAVDKLQQSAEIDSRVVTGWCFEATRFLYQKMVEIGDYGGALRAVKQMEELTRKNCIEKVTSVRKTIDTNTEDGDEETGATV